MISTHYRYKDSELYSESLVETNNKRQLDYGNNLVKNDYFVNRSSFNHCEHIPIIYDKIIKKGKHQEHLQQLDNFLKMNLITQIGTYILSYLRLHEIHLLYIYNKNMRYVIKEWLCELDNITINNIQEIPLVYYCKNIKILDLSKITNNESIEEINIQKIKKNCKKIININISGNNLLYSFKLSIIKNIKTLQTLNIIDCFDITNTHFCDIIKNNTELKYLYMDYCKSITEVGFNEIGKFCSKLEILSVVWCAYLRDTHVEKIVSNCRRLKSIKLNNCFQITDVSLYHISKYLLDLEEIDLSFCNITENGIRSLITNCKNLKILKFDWCSGITNNILEEISYKCSKIEKISIKFCINIDKTGILKMINCIKIQKIDIRGCTKINISIINNIESNIQFEM
jgi:hypothetical protein